MANPLIDDAGNIPGSGKKSLDTLTKFYVNQLEVNDEVFKLNMFTFMMKNCDFDTGELLLSKKYANDYILVTIFAFLKKINESSQMDYLLRCNSCNSGDINQTLEIHSSGDSFTEEVCNFKRTASRSEK